MESNLTLEIGEKIKKLRKSRFKENPKHFDYCRTQERFAEEFGCGRETIVNWEKNNTSPSLNDFIEICKKLECEPNYLLINKSNVKSQTINLISQVLGISIISAERRGCKKSCVYGEKSFLIGIRYVEICCQISLLLCCRISFLIIVFPVYLFLYTYIKFFVHQSGISRKEILCGCFPHPASGIRLDISGYTANADEIRPGHF